MKIGTNKNIHEKGNSPTGMKIHFQTKKPLQTLQKLSKNNGAIII